MKNKKSLVALVVMAFMLVASITMAATGAWFTADATAIDGKELNFGRIALSDQTGAVTAVSKSTPDITTDLLMPGDDLTITFSAKNAQEAAYWIAKVEVTITGTTGGVNTDAITGLSGTYGATTKVTEAVAVAKNTAFSGTITLPLAGDDYGNDYQGATIKVTVTLKVVQQENLTATEAYNLLKA